ncbi:MAG: T9SS type A sorting domain-containing protein [Cyclobacteriaceae bacterium]|nr:T9SS type A sorting domain-containing protein [Cyclobacteriaceae bacterium]
MRSITTSVNNFRFVLVLLFLGLGFHSHAQWAIDAAINNPVSTATNAQRFSQSISDGSGGIIIVWEDYRDGAADIYAQKLNAAGERQWVVSGSSNGIAISTANGQQEKPVITSDGGGGAIIAWQDLRSGNYDIYAQRINATGVTQWTADGVVISATTLNQINPKISNGPSGSANIVWEDNRSGFAGTDYDIYAQRINGSGVVQWTSNGVALCAAIGVQSTATVTSLGFGAEVGILVAWQDSRTADQDIYAQAININGVILWAANGVAVAAATGAQFKPSIAYDGNSSSHGGIITWEDYRSGNADVYAQRLNISGTAQWTANGVAIGSATGNQTKPKLVRIGTGEAIISWEDTRNGNADIFAQHVSATGVVQWTANGVGACVTTGDQTNPQLVFNPSGGAIITWEDNREATMDVYAQWLNGSGIAQWTANGLAITTAINSQSAPAIVFDDFDLIASKRGVIISWDDFRSGAADIYAQRINLSGVLCGNVSTPGTIIGAQTILAGSSNTYSVAAVVGATSYTWTLPSGWTGTSTTNSITVIANSTSGNVSVTASNACGTSAGVSLAITVNKQNQTITFNALSAKAMGDPAFNLAATASSTLPVSYVSSNQTVATINGSTVTLVGVGTTTITASQAGNDIFNAATNVLRELIVNKGNQTITFAALPSKTLGDAPFALTATSSSGLVLVYSSSNSAIATVSGNIVTLVAAGSVTIHANQAGNANYNAATQVSQNFCVNPAKPTITASQIDTETPTLTSSASVGNQWFLNDAAIAGATNVTLGVTSVGIYKLQVTVGGCPSVFSEIYTFIITGEDSFKRHQSEFLIYPNPTLDRLTVVLPDVTENKIITIYTINGQRTDFKETYNKEIQFDVDGYSPGIYLVKISSTRYNDVVRFTKQ